jgi:GNAT superfamily N-acetyltransferase
VFEEASPQEGRAAIAEQDRALELAEAATSTVGRVGLSRTAEADHGHEKDSGAVTVVVPVQPEHLEAFATLAEEMDRFSGTTEFDPIDVRLQQIRDALFGDQPSAYALLAWVNDRPVGFATYSFLWPAVGMTRSLFLKELYVSETARRAGAGKAIMQTLAETVVKNDCSRFEWQSDTPNTDAQRFYENLGEAVETSKLSYCAQGDALRRLANEQGQTSWETRQAPRPRNTMRYIARSR